MPSSCEAHATFLLISALGTRWVRSGKAMFVAHREVWVEAVALEHHCHAAGARWNFVDNVAADQEVAACLLFEPADDAQKGRLAAARRAEQNHEFAVGYLQTDAVDG